MAAHFDLPFRFTAAGPVAVVDQGSEADEVVRLTAFLWERRGHRIDRPGLGIDDPAHRQGGANIDAIRGQLAEQDPTLEAAITRDMDAFSQLVDSILIDPGAR